MKTKLAKKSSGFHLMEIMVVLFVIAVLALLLFPSLTQYLDKARKVDLMSTANAYKHTVELCIHNHNGDPSECNGGTNGIPPNQN